MSNIEKDNGIEDAGVENTNNAKNMNNNNKSQIVIDEQVMKEFQKTTFGTPC